MTAQGATRRRATARNQDRTALSKPDRNGGGPTRAQPEKGARGGADAANRGGDYMTTPAGTGLPPDEADPWWHDFDATAIVRGWISDPGSEHGLLLRANHETDPQHMAYFAAVSDRIPSVQRPVLVIIYTVSGSARTATR